MQVRTKIFEYGDKEISYLKQADRLLGEAIDRIGRIDRIIIPDLFQALVYAIIGQQISLKAVKTIWDRMQDRFEITPEYLSIAPAQVIQECGISLRKAGYIKNIAKLIQNGVFNLNDLYHLPDQEVIEQLSSLDGIGVWTAEMLLINSMERPDIVSYSDMAIRRGMMRLYGLPELTMETFNEIRGRYSPYGSVASIYLWWISH